MNKFVQIGDFILDVVLNESHKLSADVTKYPVEDGSTIADNIRPNPMEFSVEGIVTNHPLPGNLATQLSVGKSLISQPDAVSGGTTPGVIKHLRSDESYEYLRRLWQNREFVTVRTSLGVFEKMVLEDLTINRAPDTGDALKFSAQFVQIQTVTNVRLKSSKTPGYGGKNRRGHKTGHPNVGARVLWKRGIQPGGSAIYDTKYVELRANPKAPADFQQVKWWYIKNQPISLAAINFQVSKVPNGARASTEVAGFFSIFGPEENRPLSDREVFWLLKDLERDRNVERLRQFRNDVDDVFLSGLQDDQTRSAQMFASQRWSNGVIHNPYDPDILKRPFADPSRMQRSVMQKQGNGTDPVGAITTKKPLGTSNLSSPSSSLGNLTSILP